jgi:hypothetical protein
MESEIPQPHAGETPKPNVVVKRPPISFIIRKVLLEVALHLIHDFIWGGCFGIGYEVIFISSSHCVNSVSQPVNHEPVVRRKPSL